MTGALEPDENDCFVGEYYIKVNFSSVVSDNLQILPVSVFIVLYLHSFIYLFQLAHA